MRNDMTEYETLLSSITVKPKGEPIYSEKATVIALDDECAGLFVAVSQDESRIGITVEEWPHIRDSIERLLELCDDQKRDVVGKWNMKSGVSISFSKDDGDELVGRSDAVANGFAVLGREAKQRE